jgi:hypothetical protein
LTDFSHLRAEIAFRQGWKRRAESLFEANLRHTAESKTFENKLYDKNTEPITHAYVLWAANVLLAVFAPAFPLSLLRQEICPQAAQAHSLGRYGQV